MRRKENGISCLEEGREEHSKDGGEGDSKSGSDRYTSAY